MCVRRSGPKRAGGVLRRWSAVALHAAYPSCPLSMNSGSPWMIGAVTSPAAASARDRADRAARADRRRPAAQTLDARTPRRAGRGARRLPGVARLRGPRPDARRRREQLRTRADRHRPPARADAAGRGRRRRDLRRGALGLRPARFRFETAFARWNGTAPLPASSGKTVRHRLSRGGDRPVSDASTITLSRSLQHPATRSYLERPHQRGKDQREAKRALSRPRHRITGASLRRRRRGWVEVFSRRIEVFCHLPL